MTRAKFVCTWKETIQDSSWDYQADQTTNRPAARISLMAVVGTSEENKAFFKSTPAGTINLNIVNLDAAAMFEQGKEYYVDFTQAD
jgi:hypothetical protein